jgi:hypothetical protein
VVPQQLPQLRLVKAVLVGAQEGCHLQQGQSATAAAGVT